MSEVVRGRPKVNSFGQQELDKAEKQLEKFDEEVKELTLDRMNASPKEEVEPQTKLSQKELDRSKDVYLKPERSIGCRAKFNEDYRKDYEFDKEYVNFIAENKEIMGDMIELWTKPYAGVAAEFWKVPPNKPVWGPRYLAERIKNCTYHRMTMSPSVITGQDGMGQYYGSMVVDNTINRLDAYPVSQKRSVFMGSRAF